MTIDDIKLMFVRGDKWKVTRSSHGKAAPKIPGAEVRTVAFAKEELVWTEDSQVVYTSWPQASRIIESRPGYLRFTYDSGLEVTLEKIT